MKNLIKLAFAALLSISFTNVKAQNKNIGNNNSLLWEVSGNGLSTPSYITGTFHILCNKDFELKDKVLKALQKSGTVVMEINYTDPEEIKTLQKMYQADKKISDQLSSDEARELDKILADYGTNLKSVDQSSPQVLYSLLATKAIPCPQTEIKLYEMELLQNAIKNKKNIKGLEKVNDQMKSINEAYDLKSTIAQLKLGKEYEVLFKKMITAFKNEDAQSLYTLFKDERFMNSQQEKAMLTDRNKNWVAVMPAMMEKEGSFFAVGASHLMGENGIIPLLQSKGYTVKPISSL
ncbi:TraB/GumN family protein [Chryseobacterium lactis]|uniref:TraB/GumN family protein n=1 Tax=Chryseobacterium lactis TaxID=1241981 RepID=A0A3G6RW89_CHRLC|nr:TraB/GumN family protein [Chryseobacterium lactis]AZA81125.1 TraB/GumN family protein [Chryseobacterium lactis]AZB06126.1 TraB/GumN family protein [Chryseobacterium lactis]PNW14976.1 TraB/GumN family protein [Chryseobacterium lactis]